MTILNSTFLGFQVNDWDSVYTSVILSILAMLVVLLISRILKGTSKSTNQTVATVASAPVSVKSSNNDEIIAVISAAIAAYGDADGKSYTIKSITPVKKQKSKQSRSAWGSAGVYENTRPF